MAGDVETVGEDELVPISALQHMLYCPRQCALIHSERQCAENRFTAERRILHERTDAGGRERRGQWQSSEVSRSDRCDSVCPALPMWSRSTMTAVPIPSNTSAAVPRCIVPTKYSSVHRRCVWRRCWPCRLRRVPCSTVAIAVERQSPSMPGCGRSRSALRPMCDVCSPRVRLRPRSMLWGSAARAHLKSCVSHRGRIAPVPSIAGLRRPSTIEPRSAVQHARVAPSQGRGLKQTCGGI